MKKNFVRAVLIASLLGSTAFFAASQAQADDKKKDTAVTNPAIGKALQEAQDDIKKNDIPDAAAALKTAQAVPNPTPIESYYMTKFVAAIAIAQKDYATAYAAYKANAESPLILDEDKKDIYHNGMLLASTQKDWPETIVLGKQLEGINGADEQAYGVIALAYYNTGDMTNAKAYAQKSIDAAKAAGKQPNSTVMEIVMGAEAKSNDQAGALQTLEQIVLQSNKTDDWAQLTNLGLSVKGIKYIDALYVYRLKEATGSIATDDYVTAGEVAATLGYPTEAMKFFEKAISSGKGGDIPQLAKTRKDAAEDEHSLSMLAASAAKSKSGEQDVKMAEDYWGYGRYADAEASARSAIAKGGLKDASEGQVILGSALAMQGKYDEAIQTLGQVSGNEGRMKAAHLWSVYAQAKKNQAGGATTAAAPAQQPPAH